MNTIIFAGGKGQRATHLPPDLPKVMSLVAGRPVLGHVVDFAIAQGASSVTVVLGHNPQPIYDYLTRAQIIPPLFPLRICVEDYPAGTVGALHHALKTFDLTPPLVLMNGDTLFNFNLTLVVNQHGATSGVTVVRERDTNVPLGARVLGYVALTELAVSPARNVEDHVFECDTMTTFVLPGSFLDVGTPEGYALAQDWIA